MNAPARKRPPRATYADLEAVPDRFVAELIGGVLHVMPRPAPRHARASSKLGIKIGRSFDEGEGNPGGWWILDEPELHFPDPEAPGEPEVLVPDLAGWTIDRMPEVPEDKAYFDLAPDWICEVLSKSTDDYDRNEKMPIYAREGVRYAWLVDPVAKTLEVYVLGVRRRWNKPQIHRDAARVRVPPFDAVELDLSSLWVSSSRTMDEVASPAAVRKVTRLPKKKAPRR
jgi:Uma2 family endonuclease